LQTIMPLQPKVDGAQSVCAVAEVHDFVQCGPSWLNGKQMSPLLHVP
jgi:hypothetical protein